jgi:prevent-host-death family protein
MAKETTPNSLTITEARKQLPELVQLAAYQGQEFIITRNGKPMARIVPVDDECVKVVRGVIADHKDILRGLE